jgi:translation initiation factor IF-3
MKKIPYLFGHYICLPTRDGMKKIMKYPAKKKVELRFSIGDQNFDVKLADLMNFLREKGYKV